MPTLLDHNEILAAPVLGRGRPEAPPGRVASPAQPRAVDIGLCALAAILFAIAARGTIVHWIGEYTSTDSYYGFAPFVPLIVAAMLYKQRSALRAAGLRPFYPAAVLLAPALALLVFSTKMQMPAVMSAAFLWSVWSAVWLVCGSRWFRAAALPLLFLIMMAPLPGPLLNDATFSIQRLSTVLTTDMLRLCLLQPNLSGNVITLDNYQVFVDVPCSGFRLLLSLSTCFAAMAYLFDGPVRSRIALLLVTLPLSIAVNVSRLTLLCLIGECLGSPMAAVFHDWDGLFTLALGVAIMFLLARRLGCRNLAGLSLF